MRKINYKEDRDSYWNFYYPSSKVLYNLFTFLGWIFIILEFFLLLVLFGAIGSQGFLRGVGITFLFGLVVWDLLMVTIFFASREFIQFFVDRNFYLYQQTYILDTKTVDDNKTIGESINKQSPSRKDLSEERKTLGELTQYVINNISELEKKSSIFEEKKVLVKTDKKVVSKGTWDGKFLVTFQFGDKNEDGLRELKEVQKIVKYKTFGSETIYSSN